jgi:hypothetical protein
MGVLVPKPPCTFFASFRTTLFMSFMTHLSRRNRRLDPMGNYTGSAAALFLDGMYERADPRAPGRRRAAWGQYVEEAACSVASCDLPGFLAHDVLPGLHDAPPSARGRRSASALVSGITSRWNRDDWFLGPLHLLSPRLALGSLSLAGPRSSSFETQTALRSGTQESERLHLDLLAETPQSQV